MQVYLNIINLVRFLVSALMVTFTLLVLVTFELYMEKKGNLPELPFDPRLCKNTGEFRSYWVISPNDSPANVNRPVLDCSEYYDMEEFK